MYNWLPKDERNRLLRKDASEAIAWIRDYIVSRDRCESDFSNCLTKNVQAMKYNDRFNCLAIVECLEQIPFRSEECDRRLAIAKSAILDTEE